MELSLKNVEMTSSREKPSVKMLRKVNLEIELHDQMEKERPLQQHACVCQAAN